MNVESKLARLDLEYFQVLLKDMFPGFAASYVHEHDIRPEVLSALAAQGLHYNAALVEKIFSLFALLQSRFGVCLLGATVTGKSTAVRVLKEALNRLELHDRSPEIYKVLLETVNPKSVSVTELFGSVDPVTKNWTDGVLSHCLRQMAENKAELQ